MRSPTSFGHASSSSGVVAPRMDPTGFPGTIGDIVRVATENSEASPVAVAAYGLGYFSAAIDRNCRQQIGDGEIFARPWQLIVGQSSRGRKGTAEKLPAKVFRRAEEILAERNPRYKPLRVVHNGISTGPGIIHHLRDASTEVKEDGQPVDPGIPDKRVHYVEPEFGKVLSNVKHDSHLAAVLQNAFDDIKLETQTKKQPEAATHSHAVITGNITVAELLHLARRRQIENGFLNRFMLLLVHRPKLVALPRPTPADQIEALARRFAAAIEFAIELREISLSPEAEALWQAEYPDLTAEIPGPAGSLMARSEGHARMLAMIFALLDCKTQIEPEHLHAALAWIDYASVSATYIFRDYDESLVREDRISGMAERILAALRTNTEMDRTDLSGLFHRHRSPAEIAQALERLLAADPPLIVSCIEHTAGRDKTWYRLNTAPPASEVSEERTELQPA